MKQEEVSSSQLKIPFTSLKEPSDPAGKKIVVPPERLEFEILSRKNQAEKWRDSPGELPDLARDYRKICYDQSILIYLGFKKNLRPGCEIKIGEVIRSEHQVLVRASFYSCQVDYALEVIDLPYDLIRVSRAKLPARGTAINFKFLNHREQLINQVEKRI